VILPGPVSRADAVSIRARRTGVKQSPAEVLIKDARPKGKPAGCRLQQDLVRRRLGGRADGSRIGRTGPVGRTVDLGRTVRVSRRDRLGLGGTFGRVAGPSLGGFFARIAGAGFGSLGVAGG
jgi:hypothetical protein